ncbi:hypothetical protein SeLEV6574_g03967 [Synchytrium endobioticum]|uniref:EF-hand domain-containing protein n=1 Tax=Synchytrium endobioticum TaxID=286115 RepID=A0A507D1T9_9FUNG|nr:hypothetical protein SeLEV6574_g03967 [Synchytrium endobioticum]
MNKESCSVPSSLKTLPGQALVTTATSNRDLPEEQDVDCGHILAELAMVTTSRLGARVDKMLAKIEKGIASLESTPLQIKPDHGGFITLEDLEQALKIIKDHPADELIRRIVQRLDTDHDGKSYIVTTKSRMTTEEASISSSSGERLSSPMHVDDDDETTLQQNFEALKVKAAAKAAMVADALTRAEAIRKVMPFKKIMKKLASERLASHHITFNVCNPVIWSADELAAMNDNPDVVDVVGTFFRQQSFFIALGRTEIALIGVGHDSNRLRQHIVSFSNEDHVARYKEQERAVLISLCDDTDMANFLTKAVQHRFHDEKQWRNYGSTTIFNRPHGTSHVAIKFRNEKLPVSLLVLPSQPSSTNVTTAPTLPGAERPSAPLHLVALPEDTRFGAKNRYDMAGNEIPTTSYQTAKELYRESISDPTLAGGLKNTSKVLTTLKMRANEWVQNHLDVVTL